MAVRMMTSECALATVRRYLTRLELTGVLLVLGEELLDLVTSFTVWDLDVVLGVTVVGHEGKETIISDIELHTLHQPVCSHRGIAFLELLLTN